MYQSSDGETIESNDVDYAVILNVNADWLIRNIEVFNADEFSTDDQIFIVDEDNRLISKGDDAGGSESLWPDILNAYLLEEDETAYNNFIFKGPDSKDYIITFIRLDKPEWKLFKVQPSDEVFRYIDQMKTSVVLITLLFLAIAAVVSLYLSSVIYKPVGSLVEQVSNDHAAHKQGRSTQDELKYLHEVYQLSSEQIEQYEAEKMTNSSIMKAYFLQNLMVRGVLDVDDMLQAAEEYQLNVALHEPLALCYLRIDDFSQFEQYTYNDQALYRFAIANIMHELISRDFACEVVDSRREHIIMLFNPGSGTADYVKPLSEAIRLGQDYIGKYFQLSVSAAISDRVSNCEEVPKSLTQAQNLSSYRLIFGKKSIIHADLIKENEMSTSYEHETVNEKKLAELIRSGNNDKVESLLSDVFISFQKMSYNNIMLSVHQIINTVRDTVFQMNQMRLDSVYIDFSMLNDLMFKAETLDEIRECLSGFIRHTSQKESLDDKHLLLVQTMKNIVKSNYMDPGFNVQQIGDMMKMSPVYLGRVFKSVAQVPFTDYLNETRLNQAVALMRETQNSINQIMIKVGIENESYFYRLFKKKFGSTPKEFLLRNALDQYASKTKKDEQVE
jgi:AraC-like DNA-binding protein